MRKQRKTIITHNTTLSLRASQIVLNQESNNQDSWFVLCFGSSSHALCNRQDGRQAVAEQKGTKTTKGCVPHLHAGNHCSNKNEGDEKLSYEYEGGTPETILLEEGLFSKSQQEERRAECSKAVC